MADVRREIGDDMKFAQWCESELHKPLRLILKMTQVLTPVDAARTKKELMSARWAELAHKRREREHLKSMRLSSRAMQLLSSQDR